MAVASFGRVASAVLLVAVLSGCAQLSNAFANTWAIVPSVAVIGERADDPRFALVDEAVAFWNRSLEEVGSGFRLGPVSRHIQSIPREALHEFSDLVLAGRARPENTPAVLQRMPGNISVVLGDSAFISAAGPFVATHKRLVLIRTATVPPLVLPNVARNVIAHELGHALGLGHNSDFAALMCGRPSDCRPANFQSPAPRIFPLLPGETQALLSMYPPGWKPKAE